MRLPQGQPVTITVEIRDEPVPPATVGDLVDPTTLVLDALGPLGLPLISGPAPTRDSLGKYRAKLDDEILTLGHYVWRWTSAGPGAGVKTDEIDVYDPFGAEVLALADAKKYLGIAAANTVHDDEIESFIRSMTPTIEFFVGPVTPRSVRRTLIGGYQLVLPVVPALTLVSIAYGGTALVPADYLLDTETGTLTLASGYGAFPRGPLDVVWTAGRHSVDEAIGHAAKVILDHLWETQRGRGSGSGVRQRSANADTTFVPGLGYSVPNRALEYLKPLSMRTGLS